jgi:hypothetical protein
MILAYFSQISRSALVSCDLSDVDALLLPIAVIS